MDVRGTHGADQGFQTLTYINPISSSILQQTANGIRTQIFSPLQDRSFVDWSDYCGTIFLIHSFLLLLHMPN